MTGTLVVRRVLIAGDPATLMSAAVPDLRLDFGGALGDRHYGITAPANSRQARFYPRGTLIRNRRQLTMVSEEECADLAERLGVAQILPEDLGANLLVAGIPHLSALPAGSRILFDSGAGLVCEGVNQPCRLVADVVQRRYPEVPVVRGFVRAAFGRRGIAASVERPGLVGPGAHARVVPAEEHAIRI